MLGVAQRAADGEPLDPLQQHDVAGLGLLQRHPLQALESEHLGDLGRPGLPVGAEDQHLLRRP